MARIGTFSIDSQNPQEGFAQMSANCVRCLLVVFLSALILGGCGGGSAGEDLVINTAPPTDTGGGSETPTSANDPFPASDAFAGNGNRIGLDPMLNSNGTPGEGSPDLQGAEWAFSSSSPDLQGDAFAISLGGDFEDVNYVGAFAQDTADTWTEGWTVGVHGNSTVWQPRGEPASNSDCPAGTTFVEARTLPESVGGGSMDLCQLARRYDTDGQTITLTGDNIYRLAAGFPGTYIGNGEAADGNAGNDVSVTLVIESGALILGSQQEALIVTRGSRIEASGTAEAPIVMTSKDQFDEWVDGRARADGRGEWAGLALMGYGRSNECGDPCDVNAEGNIGAYGGTDDSDDSGFIQYLVIRHAGNDIDGNGNELNGLTLFATGSATRSSYVQVHYGFDDGVEHFGATDHMDHIVITGARDDSFDWGQGYRGSAQFVLIIQARDDGDRGIEADNDGDNPLAVPVSRPTLANFTILGAADSAETSSDGILLRRGTGARIYNFLVADFQDACLDVDGAATEDLFGTDLTIENSLFYCPAKEVYESGDDDVSGTAIANWVDRNPDNRIANPNLRADYRPNEVEADVANSMFVATDYVGAFAQDTDDDWTEGWTVSLNGNTTVWEPAVANPGADGSCPSGTSADGSLDLPSAVGGGRMDLCRLQRRYDTVGSTLTLSNDNIYAPASGFPGTYIGNGEEADGDASDNVSVTLKIEPGTLVLASSGEAVIITRGSRIEADGTAEDPIVMTSRRQFDDWSAGGDGAAGRGEWAGLALMGYARSNECGSPCDVAAEGNIGAYGGNDDADDSGYIRYLVIRHAGNDVDGNGNELNGLTMFATGSGTRVSYLQVHKGLDDGVEHFGASDFMDHVVITDAADDSFDWGQGYLGGAQFVVIRQSSDDADRGIEADNDGDAPNAQPISGPTLANFTMIGTEDGGTNTIGVLLRRGTGATMWNSVITGFNRCVDFDDEATFGRYDTGAIAFRNNVVSCTANFDEE
ncbi:MAG: hypothetical protein OXG29_12395 [Gammaproteobacteria bacterium]|nr:hypothetical protein [Gammaproteobacteria bacterium]